MDCTHRTLRHSLSLSLSLHQHSRPPFNFGPFHIRVQLSSHFLHNSIFHYFSPPSHLLFLFGLLNGNAVLLGGFVLPPVFSFAFNALRSNLVCMSFRRSILVLVYVDLGILDVFSMVHHVSVLNLFVNWSGSISFAKSVVGCLSRSVWGVELDLIIDIKE
ncbi:UDP-arabinose 4-epimerase 1 isoform D [Glycine soja]|uniref:UDP-arabinose 4-epimerase 1 isoform D n=1 Tax=Glycine soja TaxID=3848 RepID=A0A445JDW9_GLYSO|nr:UDP-arabinose 4-epimerase 1 isoform D [Glycine soja]